jgi:hypothetical protein
MDTQQHGAQPWVAPGEPIISLRGVTKSFGSHTVLEDVTFDVPKGRSTPGLNGPETEKRRQPRVVRPGTSGVLCCDWLSRRQRPHIPSRR